VIYKVLYTFRTPTWLACGRVWMGEAESAVAAETLVRAQHPDAEMVEIEVTPATAEALAVFEAKVERLRQWTANVARGVPNTREVL